MNAVRKPYARTGQGAVRTLSRSEISCMASSESALAVSDPTQSGAVKYSLRDSPGRRAPTLWVSTTPPSTARLTPKRGVATTTRLA